jgi:hypothetical protein
MLKIVFLALVLALAGCTTIEEDAARHYGDSEFYRAQYIAREDARIDRENAMFGAMIMNGGLIRQPAPAPVFTTCMRAACITQ